MASLIIRILLLASILWILQRLLAKILSPAGKRSAAENKTEVRNNMVKDPVCGMYMDARLAVRFDKKDEAFYFCSEECKNQYLGNSAKETGTGGAPPA